MSLLPELPEAKASGEAAAIYAEMKWLGGVPMVALIFRHLATLPGALEWMWAAVGPAWRSGVLQERAWEIARTTPMKPIGTMHPAALRAVGIDEAGLAEVHAVLEAYDRANPENMLTVLCVLRLLAGRAATATNEARPWTPPPAPGPLPPMEDPAQASGLVNGLFDLVAAPGSDAGPRVVQSLYRHFTHRPQFLALAVTLLRERFDDGSIDEATGRLRARMDAAADGLVEFLSAPPAPHPGIEAACRRFGGTVIPQMIVVGRLLAASLTPGTDPLSPTK